MNHAERTNGQVSPAQTGTCDVIKVLDYLDLVEPMPEINWAGGKRIEPTMKKFKKAFKKYWAECYPYWAIVVLVYFGYVMLWRQGMRP